MSDETNERLVKALEVVEQAASKLEALHYERLSDVLDEVSGLRVEIIAALAGFPPRPLTAATGRALGASYHSWRAA